MFTQLDFASWMFIMATSSRFGAAACSSVVKVTSLFVVTWCQLFEYWRVLCSSLRRLLRCAWNLVSVIILCIGGGCYICGVYASRVCSCGPTTNILCCCDTSTGWTVPCGTTCVVRHLLRTNCVMEKMQDLLCIMLWLDRDYDCDVGVAVRVRFLFLFVLLLGLAVGDFAQRAISAWARTSLGVTSVIFHVCTCRLFLVPWAVFLYIFLLMHIPIVVGGRYITCCSL